MNFEGWIWGNIFAETSDCVNLLSDVSPIFTEICEAFFLDICLYTRTMYKSTTLRACRVSSVWTAWPPSCNSCYVAVWVTWIRATVLCSQTHVETVRHNKGTAGRQEIAWFHIIASLVALETRWGTCAALQLFNRPAHHRTNPTLHSHTYKMSLECFFQTL